MLHLHTQITAIFIDYRCGCYLSVTDYDVFIIISLCIHLSETSKGLVDELMCLVVGSKHLLISLGVCIAVCLRVANHAGVELSVCYCYRDGEFLSMLRDLECDGYVSAIIPSALLRLRHSIYSHSSLYFQMRDSGAIWEAGCALQHNTSEV